MCLHEHLPLCHYYFSKSPFSLPIHTQHCSALVVYIEFQYGDELPLLIAARADYFLFLVYVGEICWKLLQKVGSDFFFFFFGWRLCVVDVCACARELRHSRAWWLLPLSFYAIPTFHQYMDTEPRLKPPAADWTVLFSIVFFNLNFFRLFLSLIFGLSVKQMRVSRKHSTILAICDFCSLYSSALPLFLSI